MIIDTHCHLTFPEYNEELNTIIGNAKKAHVKYFIVPGVDAFSSQRAVELAKKHPESIRASVGFHPYEAQELPNIHILKPLINSSVVAIGECGLDYHLYKGEAATGKKTNQIRLFQEHIELSIDHNLPLIMHCRDAFDDFFSTLAPYKGKVRGVIHCFSGGRQDIKEALAFNFCMGIDGNLTFSTYLQNILPDIPISHLLFETDSPYLTPIPHRGKRNEPKYIVHTISYAAKLLSITKNELIRQTTVNASSLFSFPNSASMQ
jgi:TatD DNase family protein